MTYVVKDPKSKYYQAVLTVRDPLTGAEKKVWRTTKKTNKRQAQAAADILQSEIDRGERPTPTTETLGAFLVRWLEDRASTRNLAPGTVRSYDIAIRLHITPAIGGTVLSDVTPDQIARYFAGKRRGGRKDGKPGGLSPEKVREHWAVLHGAFRQAVKWGLLLRNPVDAVDAPTVPRKEQSILTDDQARALLLQIRGDRLYPLIRTAIVTGLRQGELLALRWRDVDWEQRTVAVTRAQKSVRGGVATYGPTKARRAKARVELDESDLALLREHRAAQEQERAAAGSAWRGDEGLIFCQTDGSPLSGRDAWQALQHGLAAAGLPRVRFHDLRHTSATLLSEAGEPVEAISERLGHSNTSTTQNMYGHVTSRMRRGAARTMATLLEPKQPDPAPKTRRDSAR